MGGRDVPHPAASTENQSPLQLLSSGITLTDLRHTDLRHTACSAFVWSFSHDSLSKGRLLKILFYSQALRKERALPLPPPPNLSGLTPGFNLSGSLPPPPNYPLFCTQGHAGFYFPFIFTFTCPLTAGGRWCTTYDFTTSFLLFSPALLCPSRNCEL